MIRLVIAPRARRDIDTILLESAGGFGELVADRYRRLIGQALRDLESDPDRLGVKQRLDLPAGIETYHLRHSRGRTGVEQVRRPRHLLVLRREPERLVLIRVLHDAMDLVRHLDEPGTEP
ncbi:MAG: type II toxin-antitoxin system RelE/ParE family toxin [Proteobacteria bacterium]|nr:type II toxin-antitoxin system RelE/ParE family toxin [Pseudomonadota bacterium]